MGSATLERRLSGGRLEVSGSGTPRFLRSAAGVETRPNLMEDIAADLRGFADVIAEI